MIYRCWKLRLWWQVELCALRFVAVITLHCLGLAVMNWKKHHISENSVACIIIYWHFESGISVAVISNRTERPELKTYRRDWSCCCCTLFRLSFISFLWILVVLASSSLAAATCASSGRCCMRPIGGKDGNFDVSGSMASKSAGDVANTGNKQLKRTAGEKVN